MKAKIGSASCWRWRAITPRNIKGFNVLRFPAGSGPRNPRHVFMANTTAASCRVDGVSALPVPAPDGSVVAHGDQNAAVAAEARLPDGRGAFWKRERRTPDEEDSSRSRDQPSEAQDPYLTPEGRLHLSL